MKAIINGLRYDSTTATCIGGAQGGGSSMRDFHYWSADLYRTPRSGRFFLAGGGGALTRFGSTTSYDQNGRVCGEKIIPMSVEDAREWAEQHLTTAEVEAAFADVIQEA